MEQDKDYLYYFWNNDTQDWLTEFAHLEKEPDLKGLVNTGFSTTNLFPKLDVFDLEAVMCAQDLVACYLRAYKTKNLFNESCSSYTLKHIIENILKQVTHGRLNYVSNGALIMAMKHQGFQIKRIPGTPNCYFNVTPKSVCEAVAISNRDYENR